MMTDEQGGNMQIIITSPSLDPAENVSGISSVTRFIIENNPAAEYLHFTLGRKDNERGGWHRIGALLGRYRSWRRMLAEYPEAIIHYNFPLSKGSILRDPWFIHYAIRRRRKVVVHVHGGLFLTAPQIPGYLLRIMRGVFTQNVPFIVLSDSERQILTQRFGAREVYVLPNCVDLTDAAAYAAEGQTRAEDAPLCIGYLGRIEPNKGMSELLAACEQLQKDDLPYHLIHAGKEETTGEYLPQFAERLGDRFTYAGLVSGQTKCAFLRGFDAFVLPSYFAALALGACQCDSSTHSSYLQ